MGNTKMEVRFDEVTLDKIEKAAQNINRTPHWLIKQAISNYLTHVEKNTEIMISDKRPNDSYTDKEQDVIPTELITAYQPFLAFSKQVLIQSDKRVEITAAYRRTESESIKDLLEQARLPDVLAQETHKLAYRIAEKLRNEKITNGRIGIFQSLLQEFSLSSEEGVALMCLAEALLRIPDKQTRDALIRDKIGKGNWKSHLGKSPSLFVNAATWGLMITGNVFSIDEKNKLCDLLNLAIKKVGKSIIRKVIDRTMRFMGQQFVTGETIDSALDNSRKLEDKGFCFSYDMLGEAALTEEDASDYFDSYKKAIHAIGKSSDGRGIYKGPGISIKLSALHARYSRSQYERVMNELYPRLLSLTLQAKHYDIGINIDAEEADRLDISLDLLERLCFEKQLACWNGIGFVIQAYQKRCPFVIDAIIDIARRSNHRLMIRLVKGAYWDSEIKRAQIEGLEGYPVYTRKVYTDVAYLACARKLLDEPSLVYPQFATHNAHTLAAVYHLAGQNYYSGQYEFQCLHGMGEPLYEQVVGKISDGKLNRSCRVYAPVGTHKTLLAYLVRRFLENGANTSFVNQIADTKLSLEDLIADPIKEIEKMAKSEGKLGLSHPKIPLPRDLYGQDRLNSRGLDLSNENQLAKLSSDLLINSRKIYHVQPIISSTLDQNLDQCLEKEIVNPADHNDIIGYERQSSQEEVRFALDSAAGPGSIWFNTTASERAVMLNKAAELMENNIHNLIGILVREAGKTFNNAISEVREAVDFLRYYANLIRYDFDSRDEKGNPTYCPLGTVVCISPWNFPLAIFTGQISAALAAGNSVLAKPAEPTPIIAEKAVNIFLEAGIPKNALQMLPGKGEKVGTWLINDPRLRGVMFTGSTKVAKLLQRNISSRLDSQGRTIPLIAETGGLNAMIVDTSALTEQVITDIIASAFDSAGQRCSALRILCIQEEIAEHTLRMLRGAMSEYNMGNPERLSTDIGPVITRESQLDIEAYIETMRIKGRIIYQAARSNFDEKEWQKGFFIHPTLIELDSFDELQTEIFGPVLHVVRFKLEDLDSLVDKINATGYGLTLGIHTRIEETVLRITKRAKVGNIYVNRNMVGAVVGVQPFGGEGLSGTGPKAGGPLYLYRLLSRRPDNALLKTLARKNNKQVQEVNERKSLFIAYSALIQFLKIENKDLLNTAQNYAELSQGGTIHRLVGPTGESNTYTLLPRKRVLCIANNQKDILMQLSAVLSVGSKVLWLRNSLQTDLFHKLPALVQSCINFSDDWQCSNVFFDAVIFHGDTEKLKEFCQKMAKRDGPIISVQGFAPGETSIFLERLLIENTVSINTAAAGGNANLMTIN